MPRLYPRPIKSEYSEPRQEMKTFRRCPREVSMFLLLTIILCSFVAELSNEMIWGKNKGYFHVVQ